VPSDATNKSNKLLLQNVVNTSNEKVMITPINISMKFCNSDMSNKSNQLQASSKNCPKRYLRYARWK